MICPDKSISNYLLDLELRLRDFGTGCKESTMYLGSPHKKDFWADKRYLISILAVTGKKITSIVFWSNPTCDIPRHIYIDSHKSFQNNLKTVQNCIWYSI